MSDPPHETRSIVSKQPEIHADPAIIRGKCEEEKKGT